MAKKQKVKFTQKEGPQAKSVEPVISTDSLLQGKSLYIFLGVAGLLALYIFRDFISFQNLYLYKDIGSDTVTYWWPHYVQLSQYIHNIGIPKWAFNQGVGQNIYAFGIGDPFSLFLCLLHKDTIPYAIIFVELIKIITGGLFIYLWLRTLDVSLFTAIVGGLLYSFGGYMILGSGWYIVSTEALYAAVVLYSAERFLRHGTWYWLPIPFCLLGMLQPFYVYLYAVLLIIYCIARAAVGKQWNWKDAFIPLLKIGGLALLGVLMGSIVFFSNAMQLINNPRVTGGASNFQLLSSQPMFGIAPLIETASTIYRLFSNDLMGAGSSFKGAGNYLESPILYIGLISLLLAPQAFLFFNKQQRKVFIIVCAICFAPLVFVYLRYMFWLFAGDFFRSYTLFLSLLILFFALKALSFIDRTGVVHLKALLGTLVVLLLLLYHNFYPDNINPVDTHLRNIIACFLVLYTGLIYLMGNAKYKIHALAGIGICLFIELASFANTTVNNRVIVKADELTQKTGYNDYSVEALAYIKAKDPEFYRIYKGYHSNASMFVCLNDPQIQNFYGLTDYAEWNQFNYVSFLNELVVKNYGDSLYSKWLFGLSDRALLKTLLSVKYSLSKQKDYNWAAVGYDSVSSFGDVKVYKNKYFLPFGFTYNKFISLPEFRKAQMDIMLLNAFVADDKDIPAFSGIQQLTSANQFSPMTFDNYNAYVSALKKDSLQITHFDDNNIKGNITVDEKKLLFLSIPYDKGWHATVDGKEAITYKANIGFTGLLLDKGNHTIEMHYVVPYFAAGTATSTIAILLYAFAFIKFRKREF